MTLNETSLHPQFCRRGPDDIVSATSFLKLVSGTRNFVRGKGPRILLNFEDSYLFAVSLFACLSVGKSVVILPNTKSGTIAQFRSEYDDVLDAGSFDSIVPLEGESIEIPGDASIVFYTSGSAGEPKKIHKRFSHGLAEAQELEKTFGARAGTSTVLSTAVHQHIYGFLFKVLWPVTSKRTWMAPSTEYPEHIEQLARKLSSFTLISTPAFLKRYSGEEMRLHNCRAVFSSGGPLPFEAAALTKECFGVAPIEVYGSTESGGVAYRERVEADPIWTPFSVVKTSVLDGQLVVESPYFDEPQLVLSDRVELGPSGFKLLGRSDDIVKIEEKRVSLLEVASKLSASELVNDVVAVALDQDGRQQIGCVIVLTPAGRKQIEADGVRAVSVLLRDSLRPFFEAVVLPRKFRFVERLPYSDRSKLVKQDLLRYFHEH